VDFDAHKALCFVGFLFKLWRHMPFKLEKSGNGYFVVDDKGKKYSDEPLSKKRATAQMRALYANVPEAKELSKIAKKESELDLIPPQGVIDNVKLGMRLKANNIGVGTGMANVRSESLLEGEKQEPGTLYRMSVYFNRNRKTKDDDRVTWLLMGGDAGDNWTKETVKELSEIRREKMLIEELTEVFDEQEGEYETPIGPVLAEEYEPELEEMEEEFIPEMVENTGIMVAFFIPQENSIDLADSVPMPVPAYEMHITLAYLGDINDTDIDKADLLSAVGKFASNYYCVSGKTNGFGRFHGVAGGDDVIYANFDSPDIPSFRESLVNCLSNAGIQVSKDHGFVPHITLSYIGVDDETPDVHIPDMGIKFDTIFVAWGDERIPFKLMPKVVYAVKEFVNGLLGHKEKKLKKEKDGTHPPAHYLVVEEKEKPATWHLPVYTADGKLDHNRMGAAWAALHKGFRGSKYEGPKRGEAINKLVKLYEQEEMAVPVEITKEQRAMGGPVEPHMTYIVGDATPEIFVPSKSKEFDEVLEVAYKAEKEDRGMVVYKQSDGQYRWVTISSNGFRDRDGEIVSTKALEEDCDRADREKDYGPLRWWHVPGLDIGDCDFNMVHGHMLIESGTFRDPEIAERVKEEQDGLEISIGFTHPSSEPDDEGVFGKIRRFERSLVPKGRVSNRFTAVII
jgi:2'-5' RNA ligase